MIMLAETSINPQEWVAYLKGVADSLGPTFKYIFAVIVFLVGKVIAKGISKLVEKGLNKTSLDDKIANKLGSNAGASEKLIASFVYGLLLLFVIIISLDFAELSDVVEPLKELFNTFLSAIPNLLLAGLFLYVGSVLANVVKGLVVNLLNAARVDERIGSTFGTTPVANALGTALYCFILLLFAPVALRLLNMPEISEPISAITESILGSIPNILIAGVLIAVGVLIGQIAQKLITNLLDATGINNFPAKMGITSIPAEGRNSISGIAGLVVFISVLVLIVSAAVKELNIDILSQSAEFILGGYYNVLLAVFIFGAGFIGAKFAYKNLADKNLLLARTVNGLILFITSVVALDRSGIAPDITGLPFNVIVIALGFAAGVGGAIAIGLGGRDYVARFLEKKG